MICSIQFATMSQHSELIKKPGDAPLMALAQDSGLSNDTPFGSVKTISEISSEADVIQKKPHFSESYKKAKELGLNIMFVCFQGQERSPQSAKKALRRGESNTTYLKGGTETLYKQLVSPIRIKVQARHMAFGRNIDLDEQKQIENEITSEVKVRYREWIRKNLKDIYLVRIFTDEQSEITSLFIAALRDEAIPFEEVSMLQIKNENDTLNTPQKGFEEEDQDDVI